MSAEDVRAVIEEWARAVRNHDLAGVLAHHTEDVRIFDVPAPTQARGLAAYRTAWELFFEYSSEDLTFDLTELEVEAGDSVAFGHALLMLMGAPIRLTVGLRKVEDAWLISHEHHSVPGEAA
jgi:uncharacterized protein (TIGR02246 family)